MKEKQAGDTKSSCHFQHGLTQLIPHLAGHVAVLGLLGRRPYSVALVDQNKYLIAFFFLLNFMVTKNIMHGEAPFEECLMSGQQEGLKRFLICCLHHSHGNFSI